MKTLNDIYEIVYPIVSQYEGFSDLLIKVSKWNNNQVQLEVCVYFKDGNISAQDTNLERILIMLEAKNNCRKIKESDNFVVKID